MSLFSLSTLSIFWAGWVKGIILGTWLLSFLKLGLIDKLLLKHVGLPHVLVLAVHLVNFFGWMSQGGHSEQLLFFALFYQSTPSCLKVVGGGVGWWPMWCVWDRGLGTWTRAWQFYSPLKCFIIRRWSVNFVLMRPTRDLNPLQSGKYLIWEEFLFQP